MGFGDGAMPSIERAWRAFGAGTGREACPTKQARLYTGRMEHGPNRDALWIRLLAVLLALRATVAASSPTSTIAHLPGVQINAAKVDASGNICLAGQTTTSAGSGAAWVAKLSRDGATTFYTATFGGTGSSVATALDIDSAGAAYIAGTTTGSDFPVSAGAAQSTGGTAFAAKLDAKGNVVYSTLIGGNAQTTPRSIVVNSKGELAVSGQLITGGPSAEVVALFLFKVSADGTNIIAGAQGVGGLVAVDSQDNIYVAGVPLRIDRTSSHAGSVPRKTVYFFLWLPVSQLSLRGRPIRGKRYAGLESNPFPDLYHGEIWRRACIYRLLTPRATS